MSRPDVSLIIPSYRGESRLPGLLSCLADQDMDSFEAVVVVDGEVDGSRALLESAVAAGIPVRPVILPQNRGRVGALNAGFEAARGEVLVRCDDDLAPAPDFASGHWARHQGEPCGVVGLTEDILEDSAYARAYGTKRARGALAGGYSGALPAWRHWAANCSITRGTWERIGSYSTDYAHYGWEDVDYGYRLHEAGIPVIIAPELQTQHLGAATSTTMRMARAFHSGAARLTFDERHPGVIPAPQMPGGLWGRAVKATTGLRNEKNFTRASRTIDRLLPVLPTPVGDKLVSLLVESASLAGYRNATDLSSSF